jgi:anti-sigma-K factor RskA
LKHNTTNEECQETAALYALGALSQHEATAFESHLREGCEACEEELKEFEQVVEHLGSSASEVAPPTYLRELLLARIEKESQISPVVPFREKLEIVDAQTTTLRPAPGRAYLPWALAASIAIVALAATLAWLAARREAQEMQGQIARTRAETEQLRNQINHQANRADELAQVNTILTSPGSRVIPLSGLEPAPSSSARIFWDVQNGRWAVTADLPPAEAGKVYQLWFVTPDEKISAGLIKTDEKGHGFAVVDFPSNINQLVAAAITLEPEGGSPQPTSPVYAMGKAG